ncbi:MAG TPA: hypothetical protein VGD59_13420 [Acidisarcina sp.]
MALCLAASGCCGPGSSSNCNDQRIGPSGAEVAGIVIAAGAVVAVGVGLGIEHSRHTIEGCVSGEAGSLELTKGAKRVSLTGNIGAIKTGDLIKLHGSAVKKAKHSTAGDAFLVEKVSKDYGPCKTTP